MAIGWNKKSPYHGMWVILSMLIVVPILFCLIIWACAQKFQSHFPEQLNKVSALAIGCGAGSLFHLLCVISGCMTGGYNAMKTRLSNYRDNLQITKQYAKDMYKMDLKEYGVVFWILLTVIIANFVVFAIYAFKMLTMLNLI